MKLKVKMVARRGLVLVLAAGLLASPAFATKVYKIVDEKGNVTYTDQPPPKKKREQVELPPVNKMPTQRVTRKVSPDKEASQFKGYTQIAIASPVNDSVIGNDQLNIVVQLNLEPSLQPGHLVQFLYAGQPVGEPVAATSYSIADLQRGTYSVSANVVSESGRVLASARPVTVHVQRHFVRKQ